MNKFEKEDKRKDEELTDLKDILQFGVTIAIFLPVLLRYFLLINLPEYQANKLIIAYYISVGIWIMDYITFYLCKPILKRIKKVIFYLKFGALFIFALEAILMFFISWVTFTKEIPLSHIQIILISKTFLGIAISIFYILPAILLLVIILVIIIVSIKWLYQKWKNRDINQVYKFY